MARRAGRGSRKPIFTERSAVQMVSHVSSTLAPLQLSGRLAEEDGDDGMAVVLEDKSEPAYPAIPTASADALPGASGSDPVSGGAAATYV